MLTRTEGQPPITPLAMIRQRSSGLGDAPARHIWEEKTRLPGPRVRPLGRSEDVGPQRWDAPNVSRVFAKAQQAGRMMGHCVDAHCGWSTE